MTFLLWEVNMTEKHIQELVELLYPYFFKKLKTENAIKNCIKSTNATVTWVDAQTTTVNGTTQTITNIGKMVKVKFPYDTEDIEVINKSTSELSVGDLVCLHYNIDLKNAYVAYKA